MTTHELQKIFIDWKEEAKNDPHIGSAPKALFNEDGSFNRDNWCSKQDIIRRRLAKIICAKKMK